MKKEFTHYGQKVLLAGNRSRYEAILEKNNVPYTPLPILSKTYRVVKYNGKYAVILSKELEEDLESVIVTETLPDDLNIDALIVDVFSPLKCRQRPWPSFMMQRNFCRKSRTVQERLSRERPISPKWQEHSRFTAGRNT